MSYPGRSRGPLFTAIFELARAENVLQDYSGTWQDLRSLLISTAISSELLLNTINDPAWNYPDRTPPLRTVTNKLKSSGVLTEKQAEVFCRLAYEWNRAKHDPPPPQEMDDIAGIIKTCLDSLKDLVREHISADFDVVFPYLRLSERFPRADLERKVRMAAIMEERKRLCKTLKRALEEVHLWGEFAARRKKANEDIPFDGEWSYGLTACEVCGEVSLDDQLGECCVCGFHLDLKEAMVLDDFEQAWEPIFLSFAEWEQWLEEYPQRVEWARKDEELRRRLEELKEKARRLKHSRDDQGGER